MSAMETVMINWDLYSMGATIQHIADAKAANKKEMPPAGRFWSLLVNVLKQSIDGDAITSMAVCLSQAANNAGETFFSTQYGEKFNKLVSKVKP